MKIHNYGNDYAYQQKQKSREAEVKAQVIEEQVQEPKEVIEDAGNQVTEIVHEDVREECEEKKEVREEAESKEEGTPAETAETGETSETSTENFKKKKKRIVIEEGEF